MSVIKKIGMAIASFTAKTTMVDGDYLPIMDSEASNLPKKLSWAYVKSILKTYFDGIYSTAVKASGSEVDTGTDDAKFVTAKAINDSHNVPSVAPSTSGNVMTSNGTDWTSAAPAGGATILCAYKTADETINNSDTYQDDDHLTLSVAASSNYIVELFIFGTNPTYNTNIPGFKVNFTYPTGASTEFQGQSTDPDGATHNQVYRTVTTTGIQSIWDQSAASNAGQMFVFWRGILHTDSAGTLTVQWAQFTADPTNTTVKKGSFLRLIKV